MVVYICIIYHSYNMSRCVGNMHAWKICLGVYMIFYSNRVVGLLVRSGISFCVAVGVIRYTIEGRVSCSIDWFQQGQAQRAYKVVIFASAFILPLCILSACHTIMFIVVSISREYSRCLRLGDHSENDTRFW